MPVMSFMRQELPDSVFNETQSWVRQSSQWRHHHPHPPGPHPSSLIYFCRVFLFFFTPCHARLCYLLSSSHMWTISRLCLFNKMPQLLCASRRSPRPPFRTFFPAAGRSCSALFTAVAHQPTEDQVCLLFPSLLFRKGKMPERE